MQRKLRFGCLSLLLLLVGAAAAVAAFIAYQRHERTEKLDNSLNGEAPILPTWLRLNRECRPPNADEMRRDTVMADVAEQFPAEPSNAGLYYAIHYFGWHWRIIKDTGRCPPPAAAYQQLGLRLERAGWPHLPEDRNDLRLIEHLPPSRYLSARLGTLAFNPYPLTKGALGYDNRPYARILLAEQGSFAAAWKDKALREIVPDTKLGTSAAYLAVSVAPKEALPLIEQGQ